MKCASLEAKGPAVHLLLCCRYVTGEVSTIVMRADEETVEARSQLEAVEKVLQARSYRLSKMLQPVLTEFLSRGQDPRIRPEVRNEVRQHFLSSRSGPSVDMAGIFRQDRSDALLIRLFLHVTFDVQHGIAQLAGRDCVVCIKVRILLEPLLALVIKLPTQKSSREYLLLTLCRL